MRRSLLPLALLAAFAFGGPLVYRIDPTAIDLSRTVAAMSRAHPLGTDEPTSLLAARGTRFVVEVK